MISWLILSFRYHPFESTLIGVLVSLFYLAVVLYIEKRLIKDSPKTKSNIVPAKTVANIPRIKAAQETKSERQEYVRL